MCVDVKNVDIVYRIYLATEYTFAWPSVCNITNTDDDYRSSHLWQVTVAPRLLKEIEIR